MSGKRRRQARFPSSGPTRRMLQAPRFRRAGRRRCSVPCRKNRRARSRRPGRGGWGSASRFLPCCSGPPSRLRYRRRRLPTRACPERLSCRGLRVNLRSSGWPTRHDPQGSVCRLFGKPPSPLRCSRPRPECRPRRKVPVPLTRRATSESRPRLRVSRNSFRFSTSAVRTAGSTTRRRVEWSRLGRTPMCSVRSTSAVTRDGHRWCRGQPTQRESSNHRRCGATPGGITCPVPAPRPLPDRRRCNGSSATRPACRFCRGPMPRVVPPLAGRRLSRLWVTSAVPVHPDPASVQASPARRARSGAAWVGLPHRARLASCLPGRSGVAPV